MHDEFSPHNRMGIYLVSVALQFWRTEAVHWKRPFLPDLLFCQFNTLFPSSLWQFITQEPVICGQERSWFPLQNQHPAGGQTGCNMLYSRDLGATCACTALCVHIILNAQCEEAKFVCAITQLASALLIIQVRSLQCLSLSYVHRGHSSGSCVTTTTKIYPGEPQCKSFCLKTTLMAKSHTWAALFCLTDPWWILTASSLVLSWTFLGRKKPQTFLKKAFNGQNYPDLLRANQSNCTKDKDMQTNLA